MRTKLTRESFIPDGAIKITAKNSTAVAYVYERYDRLYAAMFAGKRTKPDSHYWYRDKARRMAAIRAYFENIATGEAAAKARNAERKNAPRGVEVGDVLRASWGYDQTNIDYYEVIGLVGKKSVRIQQIGCEYEATSDMTGRSIPVKGNYTGEPMTKKAANGGVKIDSVARAYKMEPKTLPGGVEVFDSSYESSYA